MLRWYLVSMPLTLLYLISQGEALSGRASVSLGNQLVEQLTLECLTPAPVGYERIGNSRFLVSGTRYVASDLDRACSAQGLKLASINSEAENDEVETYLVAAAEPGGLWLSPTVTRSGHGGGLSRRDGCPVLFSHFYEAEPNFVEGNSCLYITLAAPNSWIHFRRDRKALWDDNPCAGVVDTQYERRALCECNGGACPTANAVVPSLRQLGTRHLYVSNHQLIWHAAVGACHNSGMLPVVMESEAELEDAGRSLIGSEVEYWFLWLGATVEGGVISWEEPSVAFQPMLDNRKLEQRSCLNFGVGNNGKVYKQAIECTIPLHFMCKEPQAGYEIPKCQSIESFEEIVGGVWMLNGSSLTYAAAASCCKAQNMTIVEFGYIAQNLNQFLQMNSGSRRSFWVFNGDKCALANFVDDHLTLQVSCQNATQEVFCQENNTTTNATTGQFNNFPILHVTQSLPVSIAVHNHNSKPLAAHHGQFEWTWKNIASISAPFLVLLVVFLALPPLGLAILISVLANLQQLLENQN